MVGIDLETDTVDLLIMNSVGTCHLLIHFGIIQTWRTPGNCRPGKRPSLALVFSTR